MKKLLSVIAASFVTASAAAAFSASADYYEMEREEGTVVCYKWDELTDYLGIENTMVVHDPKKEDIYLVTENGDGSLTGKFLILDPLNYYMTLEESKTVKSYLKEEHPEAYVRSTNYNRDQNNFRLELRYFGFDEEMAVARDLKAEFGLMCSYLTGSETYSITLCEGDYEKAPDGLEKIRELSFDELLKMSEKDICALSPEIAELYNESKIRVFGYVNTTRAHIALKDMTGMLNEDYEGLYIPPTDEFSAMIGVPKKYIRDVIKSVYQAAASYGKRFDNVDVTFAPDADEAYQPWYVQLRIDMKLAACDSPNLYSYNFEQPGGGAPEFILYGDVNNDLEVTIADAAAILQYLGNKDKYLLDPYNLRSADCCDTGSGVTTADAIAIQKYVLGMIDGLPYSTEKSPADDGTGTVTISVIDSETQELFTGDMSFEVIRSMKNMPEGAAGAVYVTGWNSAKQNPIVISGLETNPDYSYFIQYVPKNMGGYTLALDSENSQRKFDLSDHQEKNVYLYVKKQDIKLD